MITRSIFVVAAALCLSPLAAGCAGSGESAAGGSSDLSAPGSPNTPASAASAGGAAAKSPAASPASTAPKTLASCTDTDDPTSKALLTMDANYGLTWQISGDSDTTKVVAVSGDSVNGYGIFTARGDVMNVSATTIGIGPGLAVACDANAQIEKAALDDLVRQTQASAAKKQTFATCTSAPSGVATSFTVRPPLGGAGAVIESEVVEDSHEAFTIWATDVTQNADTLTYTGDGGIEGEHEAGLSLQTLTFQGADGAASFIVGPPGAAAAGIGFTPTGCTVSGAAYAKSLIHPSGA